MCSFPAVAIAATGVASLMQGQAAKQHGEAVKTSDFQSADAAERAAADAVERGTLEDLKVALRRSAVVSAQRVAQSGTGADVNVGAPLATQGASEAVSDVDRAVVRRNAALEAFGLRERARGFRQQGMNAEAEGNAAQLGTFLSGIGKMIGMGGKIGADMNMPTGEPSADEIRQMES